MGTALAIALMGGGAAFLFGCSEKKQPPASSETAPSARCDASGAAWKTNATSGHKTLACRECHQRDVEAFACGTADSTNGKKRAVGRVGDVMDRACEACHAKGKSWVGVTATAGHKAHAGKANISCLRCHEKSIHGAKPSQALCLDCHRAVADALHARSRAAAVSCVDCHVYLARDENLTPARATCLVCHSKTAKVDFASGVHAKGDCIGCHHPHRDSRAAAGAVSRADCARCHAKLVAETVGVKKLVDSHGKCRSCHAPHDTPGRAKQSCKACHENLGGHGGAVAKARCVDCHKPHAWTKRVGAATCAKCHAKTTLAALRSTKAHRTCAACHTPHQAEAAKARCSACHARVVTAASRDGDAHAACATCHKPHAAPGRGIVACALCHKQKDHGSSEVDARANCLACHPKHDAKNRPARARCATCHEAESTLVASSAARGHNCATCHALHAKSGVGARRCESCHKKQVAKAASPSHAICATCHKPHEAGKAKARAACATCHAPETTLVTGIKGQLKTRKGQVAEKCPDARQAREAASGRCTQRYAEASSDAPTPQMGVFQKPAKGPHARCESCHNPHQLSKGAAVASCAGCHRKKKNHVAIKGAAHAPCLNCHAAHGPSPRGEASCAKCHAAVAKKIADASRPKAHATCASCHSVTKKRASGSAACRACHERLADKSKLHTVPAHARCADCHGPHDSAVKGGRRTCERCHTTKRDHHPTATACTGCHQFK